jgi:pyroglutamyl-peptidase
MHVSSTVLVTGFEPFANHAVNPSAVLADEFDGASFGGARVVGRVLPVAVSTTGDALEQAIADVDPSLVLCLGLASGRSRVAIERVAINVLDFPMPDNEGVQTVDEPVISAGPAAYFSTLPLKATAEAWRQGGVPGYVSNTAGTYLCNAVMYRALSLGAERRFRAGFLHLPELPEGAALATVERPSMALATMRDAVRIAIETALTIHEDVRAVAGAVS